MGQVRKTRVRFEIAGHGRYLTFSCYQRLPLLASGRARSACADQLMLARRRLKFGLYAWVVMPEHVHLLVLPRLPEVTVPKILSAIKRPLARTLLDELRATGSTEGLCDAGGTARFWQRGGGYDRNIFSQAEQDEKTQYIHENPIRRGLVQSIEDWRWSSARALMNRETEWPAIVR
jgi:putative transposase